jgi:hypothetical protein
MKVSKELAQEEFEKWAIAKKIKQSVRDSYKSIEEKIVESISEGILILNENLEWEHTLEFPIEGAGITSTSLLTYKLRLATGVLNVAFKGIKPDESDERLVAMIACLTGEPKGIIKALDSSTDYSLASCIATYFF